MTASVTITGFAELERKLGPQLVAGPISRFARKSGFHVMDLAMTKARAHIFDGTINNSFAVDVDPSPIPRSVTVSNNAEHAIYHEKGTRPHFPPVWAITPWAEAHGWEPYALAVHISKVGTRAYPFMEPALTEAIPAMRGFLATAAAEIEANAAGAA